MSRDRIWVRPLSSFFPANSLFAARVAQLSVLYEDLRIELYGATTDSLPLLDENAANYRQVYFLRRSAATLFDFAQAVHELEHDQGFERLRNWFSPTHADEWRSSAACLSAFYSKLQKVRNDVGGHFGLKAARHAVESLSREHVGMLEMRTTEAGGKRVVLRFAGEIAALGMTRHIGPEASLERFGSLMEEVVSAYTAATSTVQLIVNYYFRDKL